MPYEAHHSFLRLAKESVETRILTHLKTIRSLISQNHQSKSKKEAAEQQHHTLHQHHRRQQQQQASTQQRH
jgi:hypothetical protein